MSEQPPILNSPYNEPKLYCRTLPNGSLDYDKTIMGSGRFGWKFLNHIKIFKNC